MGYLEDYYNNYDEEGRLLSRHGQVEYHSLVSFYSYLSDFSLSTFSGSYHCLPGQKRFFCLPSRWAMV